MVSLIYFKYKYIINLNNSMFKKLPIVFNEVVGIYLLVVKGSVYIGQTNNSIYERGKQHKFSLVKGTHHSFKMPVKYEDCMYLAPILTFRKNSPEAQTFILETLESLLISNFRLKDLLNTCCFAPKPEFVRFIEEKFPEVLTLCSTQINKVEELVSKLLRAEERSVKGILAKSDLNFYVGFKEPKRTRKEEKKVKAIRAGWERRKAYELEFPVKIIKEAA